MMASRKSAAAVRNPEPIGFASPSPLFDPRWYAEQWPDLPPGQADLAHYLSVGWRLHKSPHPLFSVAYYFSQRTDVWERGEEPVAHFRMTGWGEGTSPHPGFDIGHYLSQGPDLRGSDPLTHYLTEGIQRGFTPNPGGADPFRWDDRGTGASAPEGSVQIDRKAIDDVVIAIGAHVPAQPPPSVVRYGLLGSLGTNHFNLAYQRLSRFALFDEADYLKLNRDLVGIDRVEHALSYGCFEVRKLASDDRIARSLGLAADGSPKRVEAPDETLPNDIFARRKTLSHRLVGDDRAAFGVYCSSLGNNFMQDIADDVANSLEAAGLTVLRGNESSSIDERPRNSIFVAPHEFFLLGDGPKWVSSDVLEDAIMYATEQAQTQWFWKALPFVLLSRGAIDMATPTSRAFADVMPSTRIVPGVQPRVLDVSQADREHPLLRAALWLRNRADPATPFAERPIDVAFFGVSSAARERFFVRAAPRLSALDCFIYLRKNAARPLRGAGPEGRLSRVAQLVSSHAKISLNIHRDEFGYIEWHRMVRLGMAVGSVVVSDICLPDPVFKQGEHFFSDTPRQLPNLLDWLLRDPDGRAEAEKMRERCFALLDEGLSPRRVGEQIARFAGSL